MKLSNLIFFVVLLWLSVAIGILFFLPGWATRGQFGDMFGAVNSLFSGLAFAGLYSALRIQQGQLELQQTQLALQRQELQMQREEMTASRVELANQVDAQRALVRATTAQISVAGYEAKIHAIKMYSEQYGTAFREQYIKQIEAIAESILSLSNKLEKE